MFVSEKLLPLFALLGTVPPMAVGAGPAGRITGEGGVFVESKDPKALMAWYRDALGIKVEN